MHIAEDGLRVSVILPAYNPGHLLREAVESVLSQSWTNWELIIVNDGCTDETANYLDSLIDTRIRVIHQANKGVSAARNAALDIAMGEWVAFLDADDVLPPDSLASRIRYQDHHPDIDIIDGRITIKDFKLDETLRERLGGIPGKYFPRLIRLDSAVFFGVAVMVRRASVGNARFKVGLTHCEDLLFLLEASNGRNWQYGAVDDSVYWYRTGGASAMTNLCGLEDGYFRLYESCHMLSECTLEDLEYLYLRIRRILVRSWLRRVRPLRALSAWRGLNKIRNPA